MRKFKACVCLELALVFACISMACARHLPITKSTDVVGIQQGPNVNETALNSAQSSKNSTKKQQIVQGDQPSEATTSQKPTMASKRGGKSHTNKTTKKMQTTEVTLNQTSTMAGKGGEKAGTDETTENNHTPKKSTEEEATTSQKPTMASKRGGKSHTNKTTKKKQTTEHKVSSAFKDLPQDETKPRRKGDSRRGFPGPKSNEHQSSHFAAIFLTSIVLVFAIYVVYHNRQKVIAVVIEGRSNENGRRRGYRKLETNVHEAMPSMKNANSTYVY